MLQSELNSVQLIALGRCQKVRKSHALCQLEGSLLRLQTLSEERNSSVDIIEDGVWLSPYALTERQDYIIKTEK